MTYREEDCRVLISVFKGSLSNRLSPKERAGRRGTTSHFALWRITVNEPSPRPLKAVAKGQHKRTSTASKSGVKIEDHIPRSRIDTMTRPECQKLWWSSQASLSQASHKERHVVLGAVSRSDKVVSELDIIKNKASLCFPLQHAAKRMVLRICNPKGREIFDKKILRHCRNQDAFAS